MRRTPLLACAWLLVVLLASELQAARPNLLFIMTDDQAPWAVGVSGNPQAVTPNLDKLFQSGAYLRNAFCVTPVCSPSRASLMTSRYGSELGITDWLNAKVEPEIGLAPGTPTWPKFLADAGYQTGLVGKWHLGHLQQYHPNVFGYQSFTGILGGGITVSNPTLEKHRKPTKIEGLTVDILTDEAIDFVRSRADQPFALSLHYRSPHAPWLPVADEDLKPYKDQEMVLPHPDFPKLNVERSKRMMREYLASVRGVDRNVGRLLAVLDELKLAENTIVIYTSDHGYNMGHNGIWHKGNGHWALTDPPPGTATVPRGQRPNMYDNSIRVLTAVRWPGVIPPNTVIDETVTHLDWFPTLLAMGGVELPEGLGIRGRNIVPLLKGETPENWDNNLYVEYSTHHQSRTQMRMFRTPRWKLMRDFLNPERDEFYDLQNDPEERTNLIHDARSEVKEAIVRLQARLVANMQGTNDPVLSLPPEPAEVAE